MSTVSPQPASHTAFAPTDFVLYSGQYSKSEEWNSKRLEIRRKLEAFGRLGEEAAASAGLALESRASLHHPFEFNGFKVERQWVYLTRAKKEKAALKKVLGAELGKDLDSSYRNLYLSLTIDEAGLEIALKIHPDAWYDGQNLKNKCSGDTGLREFVGILNRLAGFEFRIHDWKKIHNASTCTRTDLIDFFKYYVPGEHRFTLYHRVGKEDPLATSADFAGLAAECFSALVPAHRFTAWSPENDFLKLKGKL